MKPVDWTRRLPWSIVTVAVVLVCLGWIGITRCEDLAEEQENDHTDEDHRRQNDELGVRKPALKPFRDYIHGIPYAPFRENRFPNGL